MIVHNHRLVFILVLLHQILGFAWYSPVLFLDAWLASIGKNLAEVQQSDPKPFLVAIFGAFILCYWLSWIVQRLQITTPKTATWFSVSLWLSLIFPLLAVHYQFIGLPWSTVFIDSTRELLILLISTLCLARWGHVSRR